MFNIMLHHVVQESCYMWPQFSLNLKKKHSPLFDGMIGNRRNGIFSHVLCFARIIWASVHSCSNSFRRNFIFMLQRTQIRQATSPRTILHVSLTIYEAFVSKNAALCQCVGKLSIFCSSWEVFIRFEFAVRKDIAALMNCSSQAYGNNSNNISNIVYVNSLATKNCSHTLSKSYFTQDSCVLSSLPPSYQKPSYQMHKNRIYTYLRQELFAKKSYSFQMVS